MPDNFEWTDALVREMIYSKLPVPDHYCCNVQKCLDEFKKSKEKDIPKDTDWEIVSFKSKSSSGVKWVNNNGMYICPDGSKGFPRFTLFDFFTKRVSIHYDIEIESVRRLSDGVIFKLGDEVCSEKNIGHFILNQIQIINGNFIYLNSCPLENAYLLPKPKVPLFTTADLKEVFEKDTYPIYKVDKEFQILQYAACDCANWDDAKYFYSKDKAKEFQILNKPIEVCLGAIQKVIDDNWSALDNGRTTMKGITIAISDFFKSKINI